MSKRDDELQLKREMREQGIDPYAMVAPAHVTREEELLGDIRERAPRVARWFRKERATIMEERNLKAQLLESALVYMRPALAALSSRIEKKLRWVGDKTECEEWHDRQGVLILDAYKTIHEESQSSGTYGGFGVYVLSDGTTAMCKRSGWWANDYVAGAVTVKAGERTSTLAPAGLVDVAAHNPITVLETIAELLEKQSKRKEAASKSNERMKRYAAVLKDLVGRLKEDA